MSEVHNMREIENLEALVKSLEQSNERLKQSVVDLLQERVDDAILMHKAADEIERLRAALQMLYDEMNEYKSINNLSAYNNLVMRKARAALEGKA